MTKKDNTVDKSAHSSYVSACVDLQQQHIHKSFQHLQTKNGSLSELCQELTGAELAEETGTKQTSNLPQVLNHTQARTPPVSCLCD
eukprot:802898-Amphidinium_carterae.1